MSHFMISFLNMSLTASYVALIIIAIRFIMNRLRISKIFSYVLWIVVLIRLTIPVSFESIFSMVPGTTNMIPQNIIYVENPTLNFEIPFVNSSVNTSVQSVSLPVNFENSVNPIQILLEVFFVIWMFGVLVLLLYFLLSYIKLRRRIAFATRVKDNIFECDQIRTPFVMGLIKPRIFLPLYLSNKDIGYIVKHERAHIKRYDHWIKSLALFATVLHWFNPVVWISFFLMTKDMEMSCDEKVIGKEHDDNRTDYSKALLKLAMKQNGLLGPLSFGESHVKSRVKNVLNYKRPSFSIAISIIVVLTIVAIGLLINPTNSREIISSEGKPNVIAGYISLDDEILLLEQVEIVTTEKFDQITGLDLHDSNRMKELQLTVDDLPNGYHIHELDREAISLELTEDTIYHFTDYYLLFVKNAEGDRQYTTKKKENFIAHLNESSVSIDFPNKSSYPFFIEIIDGKVIGISEVFIFTQ